MLDLTENSRARHPDRREVELRRPTVDDGAAMWRLAGDTGVLDLNSSYAYLLWAHDFADTSVVATTGGDPAGFVSGYRRPSEPDTLMVWQVAVAQDHRGQGLARRMLDRLVEDCAEQGRPVSHLETTITEDNAASIALFTSFADAHGAAVSRAPLFPAESFPDGHDTEVLFRIGPLTR